MFESGELFYNIAGLLSLLAFVLTNILWLRIFLVLTTIFYVISGVMLEITSMIGWNSAFFVINLYHVVFLFWDKSTITLPKETKEIYHLSFSTMSTREFKKVITINQFQTIKGGQLITEGERTNRLFIILEGKVSIIKFGKTIALLNVGDLIGEMSFMSKEPASANAIATEQIKYAYWNHDDLDKLCQKNCYLYNKFISIIGNDLVRKLNSTNDDLSPKPS